MKLIHATTVAGHSASLDISVYMNRYIHVRERNLLHVIDVTSALVDYIISKSIKKKFMLVKGLLPVMSVTWSLQWKEISLCMERCIWERKSSLVMIVESCLLGQGIFANTWEYIQERNLISAIIVASASVKVETSNNIWENTQEKSLLSVNSVADVSVNLEIFMLTGIDILKHARVCQMVPIKVLPHS